MSNEGSLISRTSSLTSHEASSDSPSAHLSAHLIPPEILLQCFTLIKENEPPSFGLEDTKLGVGWAFKRVRTLGWIKVTHVCRYWRQTAICCGNMWTSLSQDVPEDLYNVMLARARDAPLIVADRLASPFILLRSFRLVTTPLLRQIKELKLHGAFDSMCKFSEAGFRGPAPLLEHLELSGAASSTLRNERRTMKMFTSSTFSRHAPRLTSVKVTLLPFPEPLSIFRNVSQFSYELGHRQPGHASWLCLGCTPTRLLEVLSCMPLLQILRLHHCFLTGLDKDALTALSLVPTIKLPHLLFLDIAENFCGCIIILRYIQFPSSSRVAIECRSSTLRQRDAPVFLADHELLFQTLFVWKNTHHGCSQPLRTVYLNVSDDGSAWAHWMGKRFTCFGWREEMALRGDPDFDSWEARDALQPDIALDLVVPIGELKVDWSIVRTVMASMDLAAVNTLSVRFPTVDWGVTEWTELAHHFPSVQKLVVRVSKLSPEVLSLILSHGTQVSHDAHTPKASFPMLSHLALRATGLETDTILFRRGLPAHWQQLIIGLLEKRRDQGVLPVLQTLSLPSFNVRAGRVADIEMDRLRGLVAEVIVDSREPDVIL